jgi:hemerythrin
MAKKVTNDFRVSVRDWVAYDDKIVKAKDAIKRVQEKQSQIGSGIINFMNQNNLQKKEIKISNCRLQYKTHNKITPLTKKFILNSLSEYLEDEEEAKEMIKILYDVKKRMKICFIDHFNDEEKAIEAVDYIFNKRKQEEITTIKRKIQRIPVTIDNGPISEFAQNTIRTPENTDTE